MGVCGSALKIGLGLLLGREHGGGLLHAGCHRGYIDLDVVESSAAIAFQALALIPADLCDNIVIGCQYEDERDQKNGDKLA
jgi:hypothetical protein